MKRKIGILVCDYQGLLSDRVDTGRVVVEAVLLHQVALVDRRDFLCGDAGALTLR